MFNIKLNKLNKSKSVVECALSGVDWNQTICYCYPTELLYFQAVDGEENTCVWSRTFLKPSLGC